MPTDKPKCPECDDDDQFPHQTRCGCKPPETNPQHTRKSGGNMSTSASEDADDLQAAREALAEYHENPNQDPEISRPEAPERIWINPSGNRFSVSQPKNHKGIEYVRADLYKRLERERDEIRKFFVNEAVPNALHCERTRIVEGLEALPVLPYEIEPNEFTGDPGGEVATIPKDEAIRIVKGETDG